MLPQLNITQWRIKLEVNTDLVISVLKFIRLCLRETLVAAGSRNSGNVLFPMNLYMFLSFFPPFFSTYLERKEVARTTFPLSSFNLLRLSFDSLLPNFSNCAKEITLSLKSSCTDSSTKRKSWILSCINFDLPYGQIFAYCFLFLFFAYGCFHCIRIKPCSFIFTLHVIANFIFNHDFWWFLSIALRIPYCAYKSRNQAKKRAHSENAVLFFNHYTF